MLARLNAHDLGGVAGDVGGAVLASSRLLKKSLASRIGM
jgi:cobalamin synthase